ncbi:MAG TPA: signal peptidase I [Clostridiales bacterium]|nr:signal peptidase I [Clostridiales bacterium]
MRELLIQTGKVLFIAVAATYMIRRFVLYVTLVSSNSMIPTLAPNKRVLTYRIHGFNKIHRGDIIVFHSQEIGKTLIKRVIGLPGDSIKMHKSGDVIVNGKKLDEPYVKYPGGPAGNYQVPLDEYFVLGDNRAQSNDSRHWKNKTILRKYILGITKQGSAKFNKVK